MASSTNLLGGNGSDAAGTFTTPSWMRLIEHNLNDGAVLFELGPLALGARRQSVGSIIERNPLIAIRTDIHTLSGHLPGFE